MLGGKGWVGLRQNGRAVGRRLCVCVCGRPRMHTLAGAYIPVYHWYGGCGPAPFLSCFLTRRSDISDVGNLLKNISGPWTKCICWLTMATIS